MIDGPSALRAAAALGLALALDRAVGEFPARLHPVVWIGGAITALQRWAPRGGRARQLAWGALAAVGVPGLAAAVAWGAARALAPLGWAGVPLEAVLLKPAFAVRALGEAGARVERALRAEDVPAARAGLSWLCSRDPSALGAPQLAAAAVESIAENSSDSAVAPFLFYAVLGLPGAWLYRAANTLDARVGYHGKYEWLGKFPARLDDLLNLVPARLTALLLLAAGAARGGDVRGGARVLRRDGGKTESPNAGRPMAAMAGLLGVELAKEGHYRLGDPRSQPGAVHLAQAWRIAGLATLLAAAVAVAAAGGLHGLR